MGFVSTSPPHRGDLDSLFAALRRSPDVESRELRAWDAADRYVLDTAAPLLAHADTVAVVDDTHGALALGAGALGAARVRVHQDSLVARRALEANAARAGVDSIEHANLDDVVTQDAALVLLRLPRSRDRLDDVARALAARMTADAVLIAGNMVKHMTPTQNEVLRASFDRVDVSLTRGKARLLTATAPRSSVRLEPSRALLNEPALGTSLHVVALPGVFAGATLDRGTRVMLASSADVTERLGDTATVIDLACGSGIVASWLGLRAPGARVIATDVSSIAVESARLTAEANDVRVEAYQDDGLSIHPDASADLVMLNPPFHVGAAVHTGVAHRLFAEAARVLRVGGELRCVWNAHLGYRAVLERMVGPTRQVHRDATFIVTSTIRRGA